MEKLPIEKRIEEELKRSLYQPEFIIAGEKGQNSYSIFLIDNTSLYWNHPHTLHTVPHTATPDIFLDYLIHAITKTPEIIATQAADNGIVLIDSIDKIPAYLDHLTESVPPTQAMTALGNRPYITLYELDAPQNRVLPHRSAIKERLPQNIKMF